MLFGAVAVIMGITTLIIINSLVQKHRSQSTGSH